MSYSSHHFYDYNHRLGLLQMMALFLGGPDPSDSDPARSPVCQCHLQWHWYWQPEGEVAVLRRRDVTVTVAWVATLARLETSLGGKT